MAAAEAVFDTELLKDLLQMPVHGSGADVEDDTDVLVRFAARTHRRTSIARALVTRPRLLLLDEPTEGIQPSIIKDIGRVISLLGRSGEMAILLVEQYFDFAHGLADRIAIMDRGEIVIDEAVTAIAPRSGPPPGLRIEPPPRHKPKRRLQG